jgi:hypothetical protein
MIAGKTGTDHCDPQSALVAIGAEALNEGLEEAGRVTLPGQDRPQQFAGEGGVHIVLIAIVAA